MSRSGEFLKIRTRQRFPAGQMQMQNAHPCCFREDPQPVFGFQLRTCGGEFQRIGTIHAVQRTAMGNLGNESERVRKHQ